MTETTISFSSSGQALFSSEEVHRLMRVEFERAMRYSYNVACVLVQVDRLPALETVHGCDAKVEMLRTVVETMKKEIRCSDFLGCMVDDRVLALFPHTSGEDAKYFAQRLLRSVKEVRFDARGMQIKLTLSIGLSHNQQEGKLSFETLMRVAEDGLNVADASGGDRFVETQLYQLYENQFRRQTVEEMHQPTPAPEAGEELRRLFDMKMEERSHADLEAMASQLADDLIAKQLAQVKGGLEAEKNDAVSAAQSAHRDEVLQLERRISKLMGSLGMTEAELARLRGMKGIDEGLSSIYREVQGLDTGDARADLKRELMQKIFAANINMRAARDQPAT